MHHQEPEFAKARRIRLLLDPKLLEEKAWRRWISNLRHLNLSINSLSFQLLGEVFFFMLIQLDWFKGKWDNLDEGENRLFQSQKKHPNDPSNGELDGISHPNLFPKFGFWKIKKNVHLMPMKISLQTSASEKKKTSGWRLHQWLLLVPGYRENLKRSFKEAGSIRSVASWTASWGESSFADSLPSGYVKIVI